MGVVLLITGFAEPGITASGTYTHPGTAACPPYVPFGTQLSVEGIGVVTCEDSYAAGLRDRVDIFEPTVADCYAVTGWRLVQTTNQ